MKQYVLFAAILFLVLTSTTFAFKKKAGEPLEPESRIQLNEDTGQWKVVDSKSADRADKRPSYITKPNCPVPPLKDLFAAPHLVDSLIDNECVNPVELEKVIVLIAKAIPAEKVKDNMNAFDLLSRLATSNKLYRAKKKYYEKIASEDQLKEMPKPIEEQPEELPESTEDQPKEIPESTEDQPKEIPESITISKVNCTKNVDDNGLIEETFDLYFPVDRFGPKPHSLNDWCYDQDNKELSIIINHRHESEDTANGLANSILQHMILESRAMKQLNQRVSSFQECILSKGMTVTITWPGRKSPAGWAWAKSQ
jgi:hypothetical protein